MVFRDEVAESGVSQVAGDVLGEAASCRRDLIGAGDSERYPYNRVDLFGASAGHTLAPELVGRLPCIRVLHKAFSYSYTIVASRSITGRFDTGRFDEVVLMGFEPIFHGLHRRSAPQGGLWQLGVVKMNIAHQSLIRAKAKAKIALIRLCLHR